MLGVHRDTDNLCTDDVFTSSRRSLSPDFGPTATEYDRLSPIDVTFKGTSNFR